jgi:hypothetical protein
MTVCPSTGNCCHGSRDAASSSKDRLNNHNLRITVKQSSSVNEIREGTHVVVVPVKQSLEEDEKLEQVSVLQQHQQKNNNRETSLLSSKGELNSGSILSNKSRRVIQRRISQEEKEQFSRIREFLMKKKTSGLLCGCQHSNDSCDSCCSQGEEELDLSVSLGQFFDLLPFGLLGNEYAALLSSKGFTDLKTLMFQVSAQEVEDLLSTFIHNAMHLNFLLNSLDFLRDLCSTHGSLDATATKNAKSSNEKSSTGLLICQDTSQSNNGEILDKKREEEDSTAEKIRISEIEKNNTNNSLTMSDGIERESEFSAGNHTKRGNKTPDNNSHSKSISEQKTPLVSGTDNINKTRAPDNQSRSSFIPSLRSNKRNGQRNKYQALTAKSAPSTPALEMTTDDLTNWFRNKLHFFGGNSS